MMKHLMPLAQSSPQHHRLIRKAKAGARIVLRVNYSGCSLMAREQNASNREGKILDLKKKSYTYTYLYIFHQNYCISLRECMDTAQHP